MYTNNEEKLGINRRSLSRTGSVCPRNIAVIIVGIISIFFASNSASAFGLELVKKELMRKSEMNLSQQQIATRPNIPAIDLSQPEKFETATFGLG